MPPLTFPQLSTAKALELFLDQALTLRLYSNNRTPQVTDTVAQFVEVTGGGYASIALNSAQWTITSGTPSIALYNSFQDFTFSSVPAINVVYGYYVTNADDLLVWAEEFDPNDIPFVIITPGQRIQIRPRIGADNLIYTPPELE